MRTQKRGMEVGIKFYGSMVQANYRSLISVGIELYPIRSSVLIGENLRMRSSDGYDIIDLRAIIHAYP